MLGSILLILSDMFRFGELSPVFFLFRETGGVIDVIITSESDMAVDADEGCGSTSAVSVFFDLLLLEGDITVNTDKRNHC